MPQHYILNRSLGKWVAKQREQFRFHQEGKHSFLTEERIDLLKSVGFVWQIKGRGGGAKRAKGGGAKRAKGGGAKRALKEAKEAHARGGVDNGEPPMSKYKRDLASDRSLPLPSVVDDENGKMPAAALTPTSPAGTASLVMTADKLFAVPVAAADAKGAAAGSAAPTPASDASPPDNVPALFVFCSETGPDPSVDPKSGVKPQDDSDCLVDTDNEETGTLTLHEIEILLEDDELEDDSLEAKDQDSIDRELLRPGLQKGADTWEDPIGPSAMEDPLSFLNPQQSPVRDHEKGGGIGTLTRVGAVNPAELLPKPPTPPTPPPPAAAAAADSSEDDPNSLSAVHEGYRRLLDSPCDLTGQYTDGKGELILLATPKCKTSFRGKLFF